MYEGLTIPAALHGVETWSTVAAGKMRLNLREIKGLRSAYGVMCVERIRNAEVRRYGCDKGGGRSNRGVLSKMVWPRAEDGERPSSGVSMMVRSMGEKERTTGQEMVLYSHQNGLPLRDRRGRSTFC